MEHIMTMAKIPKEEKNTFYDIALSEDYDHLLFCSIQMLNSIEDTGDADC